MTVTCDSVTVQLISVRKEKPSTNELHCTQGAEENIWTSEGKGNGRLEKTT
jgi:hypothetical protein